MKKHCVGHLVAATTCHTAMRLPLGGKIQTAFLHHPLKVFYERSKGNRSAWQTTGGPDHPEAATGNGTFFCLAAAAPFSAHKPAPDKDQCPRPMTAAPIAMYMPVPGFQPDDLHFMSRVELCDAY